MKTPKFYKCFILCYFIFLSITIAQTYQVQQGDTLSSIARNFGVSASELISLNNLENPDLVKIGQVLVISLDNSWPESFPYPFSGVTLSPKVAIQGQAVLLKLSVLEEANITANFLAQDYKFASDQQQWVTIIPVSVLQSVGTFPLTISADLGNGEVAQLELPISISSGNYDREAINLPPSTSSLLKPEITRAEHQLMEETCSFYEPIRRWQGAFQYPVGSPFHTSAFGTLRSYNGGPYRNFHRGLDLRGNSTTPIYAAASGKVILADALQVRGNTVVLSHGLGVCSGYMHLSNIVVEKDQEVTTDTILGYAGDTGLVTAAHLHWEVRIMGAPIDPLQWVNNPLFVE